MRALLAGALGVGAVLALLPAGGHDQLWVLYAAGRMLHGVQLYGPEFFESNPPLIFWLSAVPAALARLLHVQPSFAAKTLVCALLAAVFATSLRILRLTTPRLPCRAELLALFFAVAYLCVPARDFGQREHLLSLLVLPWLLLTAPLAGTRDEPADAPQPARITLRCLAGFLAGIGICLKPQEALVPLCVEIALLLATRTFPRLSKRPEPYLILGTCLGYLGLMRLVTPAYFTTILPVLRQTYWAIGHLSPAQLLGESLQLQVFFLAAIALCGTARNHLTPATRTLAIAFLAAAFGGNLAYLQQGTGWYYQQIPAIVFSLAAITTALTALLASRPIALPRRTPVALAFLAALATFLTLHFSGYPVSTDRAYALTSPDPALFRDLPDGTPIATLTTSVDEAVMPVARYHLFWAQRTNNLWWMPAILRAEAGEPRALRKLPPTQLQQLAYLQRANMAADLDRWRPTLVLIERCHDPAVRCQVIEDLFPDLLQWFSQDAAFRTAFAPYARTGTSGRFDVYRRTR